MDSLWTKTVTMPEFESMQGDLKTDVLIVGGGIAGILCAHALHQAGVDYALVEAKRICSGISCNTTAKITSQHGLIYHKIAKRYGFDCAGLYLEANERALAEYRTLCGEIDCDYRELPNYVYSMDDRKGLEQELRVLQRLGYSAQFKENLPLPFSAVGAVEFPRQAQFHPLKFLAELAKPLRIYEQTKVREFTSEKIVTNRGAITAEKVIIATHFPMLNKHGMYFLKLYQHRSYVLALQDAAEMNGMLVDAADTGMSFRNYQDLLLLGGGGHRTGKQGGNWRELRAFAARHYPYSRIQAGWATQDCMTLDGMPYIGQYSKHTPNLYVATGFNKWGMTSAMTAAQMLVDLVRGKENPYEAVFDPSRTMLHPQLLMNMGESTLGILTPTVPRCPHMGCALKYNRQEHSWDCSCHGSRFHHDGTLLDNPATDDMK